MNTGLHPIHSVRGNKGLFSLELPITRKNQIFQTTVLSSKRYAKLLEMESLNDKKTFVKGPAGVSSLPGRSSNGIDFSSRLQERLFGTRWPSMDFVRDLCYCYAVLRSFLPGRPLS